MTEEEAIEILREEHDYAQLPWYVNQALEMAINALYGNVISDKNFNENIKSEIEMLENENQSLRVVANSYKLHYNETSAEAIKEFTERLKNKIKTECNPYGKPTFDYDTSLAIMRYIDNLVKEMVGEKE